ncbi:MAG: polyprenol monophosphomannose synthase, partial [Alistipes sp.]|nr:polyprenol monophosphomannose synthase [Alistipes sp.]
MRRLIIIPTYNEKENVTKMIDRLMAMPEGFDLLIVDDGSPDGTANLVREAQTRYGERVAMIGRSGKLGLGTAYIAGFKYALDKGYDRIFEMDCDFSHNPDDLPRLDAMLESKSVAIGSRYSRGVNVVNWPMGRLLMSYFASKYVRIITCMPVADATAGFVGYRREVLEAIDFDRVAMNGYGFQIEMKYTAWRLGFSIGEVSII